MITSSNRLVVWIINYPIAGFIILTFLISYVLGMPFIMLVSDPLRNSGEVISLVFPRLLIVYGPGLSAIIITLILSGRSGLILLLRKLRPEMKHVGWWILIPTTFSFLTFYSYSLGGQPFEHIVNVLKNNWQMLIFHFIGQLFVVGLGEELGWRAWLLPRLLNKGNVVFAVISIIIIWGLWHFPLLFSGYKFLLPWIILLISLAFIFTWLCYKVEGNIFVLAIAHASVNAPIYFIENRLKTVTGDNKFLLTGWTILSLAYLLLALIILLSSWWSKDSVMKKITSFST